MAKMIRNKRCVICGESPVLMWTIDNMSTVSVTYLCEDHGAPLQEIMELAGTLPPDRQVPVPERGLEELDTHLRGKSVSKMTPLLNWTPPEDPGPVPGQAEAEAAAEDLLVMTARGEGKPWDEIAAMLDKSNHYVTTKYGKKYKFVPPGKKLA